MRNFDRLSIYLISFFTSLVIFLCFGDYRTFDKTDTLSLMISVISIIVAIIITFLFSKLFSEKSIKIERKKEIDELSIKITNLRRIAFHIRGMHEFWKIGKSNAKSVIDYKYKKLKFEEYRGYDGYHKYEHDDWKKIDDEISGTIGQSYLALKGLEDGQNTFSFFAEFNPKNYSLEDVARYQDYAGSFWSFLDRSSSERVNFNNVSRYELNFIDELFFKIVGRQINKADYISEIKELLSSFESEIFQKHYYLTQLNSDNYPSIFKNSFNNMLIFILLLIFSLILYVIAFDQIMSFSVSVILLSLFISNTIDLLIITINSIKSELSVNEIYKI
jgi:hypothetical protein